MEQEKTLVLIKPDAFSKKYSGEILARYEREGLSVVAMKIVRMDAHLAALHYVDHIGKPYYEDLIGFMTSGPIVAMVLEGEDAIARVREINGKTNPKDAAEGTIRRQFATSGSRNAVHASDSPESARREIRNFFSAMEIFDEAYDVPE